MVNGYDLLEKPVISKTKYKIKSTNGGILFYIRICMYVCMYICVRESICVYVRVFHLHFEHTLFSQHVDVWDTKMEWKLRINCNELVCFVLHHVICWCCQHEHERRCTVAFYVPTVLKMFKCSRWIILSSRWLAIAIATCVLCLLYFCDCVYFFFPCVCVF